LFLDRTRKRDTRDVGAQMLGALAEGQALGIFPEGTTSDGSVLLPFFSPLLQPAVAAQAELVPTAIRYSLSDGSPNVGLAFIGEQTFLESVTITLQQPLTEVDLYFGAPMASTGLNRRELTQRVETAVAALLNVKVDRHWRAPAGPAGATTPSSTPMHARSRQRDEAASEDQAAG
jgi:1-acyl-sn-glycerol-3-phosphate acyltransferase